MPAGHLTYLVELRHRASGTSILVQWFVQFRRHDERKLLDLTVKRGCGADLEISLVPRKIDRVGGRLTSERSAWSTLGEIFISHCNLMVGCHFASGKGAANDKGCFFQSFDQFVLIDLLSLAFPLFFFKLL